MDAAALTGAGLTVVLTQVLNPKNHQVRVTLADHDRDAIRRASAAVRRGQVLRDSAERELAVDLARLRLRTALGRCGRPGPGRFPLGG